MINDFQDVKIDNVRDYWLKLGQSIINYIGNFILLEVSRKSRV